MIYKVMQRILSFQRDFFEKGIAFLKPMVLRDVARDISMHESTISRVTTNKYAHTPQGIFELKYFFNSSINLCWKLYPRPHGAYQIIHLTARDGLFFQQKLCQLM